MKIAIFSDTHLGYLRFEEDAVVQAERVIKDASERADLLICAGDVFDTKIPKLETIKRAIEIFRLCKKKMYVIHGNHERRTKDVVNPVQLLAAGSSIHFLHGSSDIFEHNNERVQILGLGSVPEEYATEALTNILSKFNSDKDAFRILVLHQTLKELVPNQVGNELSLEYLETLPFDLIVNGHIHETMSRLGGRLLIPGSTVVTQVKKDQTGPRGYFLYDTKTKKEEVIAVPSREFVHIDAKFDSATEAQIRLELREQIAKTKKEKPNATIAVRVNGTLAEGTESVNLKFNEFSDVFISNHLANAGLGAKLEKIRFFRSENLSSRDLAIAELKKKTEGKILLFDSSVLFEKLTIGIEEAQGYLESIKNNASKS